MAFKQNMVDMDDFKNKDLDEIQYPIEVYAPRIEQDIYDEIPDRTVERLPIIFMIDTSSSMDLPMDCLDNGHISKMEKVNEGLESLKKQLLNVKDVAERVDLGIITFGKDGVKIQRELCDFMSWERDDYVAGGCTPLNSAVIEMFTMIKRRKEWYIDNSIKYKCPIVVIFSDGNPTDDSGHEDYKWRDIADSIHNQANNKHLLCYTIFFGKETDEGADKMREFASKPNYAFNCETINDVVDAFEFVSNSILTQSSRADVVGRAKKSLLGIEPVEFCEV